jgi:hypothetical protein
MTYNDNCKKCGEWLERNSSVCGERGKSSI